MDPATILTRWLTHQRQLNNGKHKNPHLQNAWNLYGAGSFEFRLVYPCEREVLIVEEQAAIDRLGELLQLYNVNLTANTTAGWTGKKGRIFSPEHRAKLSAAKIGNTNWLNSPINGRKKKATMLREK